MAEGVQAQKAGSGVTKYKAKSVVKTFADGASIRFDSMAEAAFYEKMVLTKTKFVFHPACYFTIEGSVYRPDYLVETENGYYYLELKGGRIRKSDGKKITSESPMWKRTRKQLRERYPNLNLMLVYGRADKSRGFVTEWTEWLNEPQPKS